VVLMDGSGNDLLSPFDHGAILVVVVFIIHLLCLLNWKEDTREAVA
jgi:hypothetical protein